MKAHFRRLSRDAAFYGGGNALSRLSSFFLAPIMTAVFSPVDYGVMSLLQTVFGFMIVIALLNIGSGVFFYFYDNEKSADKRVVLSTSLFFHCLVGVFFSGVIWIFAPAFSDLLNIRAIQADAQDYTHYIRILSVGLFFSIMNGEFKSVLRMLARPKRFFVLTVTEIVFGLCSTLLLVVVLGLGIEGAFIATIITNIVGCTLGFVLVRDQYMPTFSRAYLGLFFAYALPQFPSVFFNWGLAQSNLFFLNYYSVLSEIGLYSIGLKVTGVFLLFSMAFRMAWDPFAFSIMKQEDAREIYRRFYNYYTFFFLWLAGGIALFGKTVLIVLTPEAYHSAYSIASVLTFAYFLQTGNNILAIGINISKKTKYISYIQGMVFLSVLLFSVTLIPAYGGLGAAYVFLLGSLVQSILYYLIAERLWHVGYHFWQMLIFAVCIFFGVQAVLYLMTGTRVLILNLALSTLFSLVLSGALAGMLHYTDRSALPRALSWCRAAVQRPQVRV